MKMKKTVITAALWMAAMAVGFAADPNVGSWKLNEAKSKIAAVVGGSNCTLSGSGSLASS